MKTIQEQVNELHATMAESVPSEALAIFAADIARFSTNGVPASAITVGEAVPNVTLLDVKGHEVSLHSLLTAEKTVIVVYRGAWCPYCNLTLRTYQNELVEALASRGISLIAISPQKPEGLEAMRGSHDLSFGVYSDVSGAFIDALGVWAMPSDEVIALQAEFGLAVPESNSDGTSREPMPTTAIVTSDGVIEFIDIHPDFTTRTEVADILGAVSQ